MKFAVICFAVALFVSVGADDAFGQQNGMWRFGFGGGESILTGTPHRPRPQEGEGITGAAGPGNGGYFRILAERDVGHRLSFRTSAFYDKLDTKSETFNCIRDEESGSRQTATCYPAAQTDIATGLMVGGAISVGSRVRSMLTAGFGFARYSLTANTQDFPGLANAVHVRPVVSGGLGISLPLFGITLLGEGALHVSLGDGGGTAFIPLTVNVLF